MIQTITFSEVAIHGNKSVKCAGGWLREVTEALALVNKPADSER